MNFVVVTNFRLVPKGDLGVETRTHVVVHGFETALEARLFEELFSTLLVEAGGEEVEGAKYEADGRYKVVPVTADSDFHGLARAAVESAGQTKEAS